MAGEFYVSIPMRTDGQKEGRNGSHAEEPETP